jgi:hypothetical protein
LAMTAQAHEENRLIEDDFDGLRLGRATIK